MFGSIGVCVPVKFFIYFFCFCLFISVCYIIEYVYFYILYVCLHVCECSYATCLWPEFLYAIKFCSVLFDNSFLFSFTIRG